MKIRHKLLLILLVTAAAASALIGVGATRVLRSALRERFTERLRVESRLLAGWVEQAGHSANLQSLAVDSARRIGERVTLVSADGIVLGDSARDERTVRLMENHMDRPEIRDAAARGSGHSRRTSTTTGSRYAYMAVRLDTGGPVRFVRIALPVERMTVVERGYLWALFSLIGASFLVLTAVTYGVVLRLARPIERMSEAAERTAAGELEIDVPYGEEDELSRLGAAVNRMRASLLGKIGELDGERRLLLSVLGGMKEGLLVVGADRRIRMANDAFRQIFGLRLDPTERLLAEVIRNPTVLRDLEASQSEGRSVTDSVLRAADSGRSFELHVTPLDGGGSLILFFDITQLEALEVVRRDFVANVSHELRTPLTSIKAFVETVLAGRLEDHDSSLRFLRIVRKHADRMGELIDDLTDLSLIETGSVDLELELVDATDVAREVAGELSHRHAGLEVEIRVELSSPFRIRADRRRLEQILVNLVDNGVKFNRPGGRVRITGEIEDGRAVLAVRDDGVGIPADSLERIFNRFYRVDKARSREVGGTGLGLAIVKHLMRLHGGQVRVESEPGHGSAFFLDFSPGLEGSEQPGATSA